MSAYTQDPTLGNSDEVRDVSLSPCRLPKLSTSAPSQNCLAAQHQLTYLSTSHTALIAEIETVSAALGGLYTNQF